MIFVAGLIILALTWAAGAVYLLRRGKRRLPDIGTREKHCSNTCARSIRCAPS